MASGDNERIRAWVIENHIEPARKRGANSVTIVSGDVHARMRLYNRMPAVCSALDARKLEVAARVRRLKRQGPEASSTVSWTFAL